MPNLCDVCLAYLTDQNKSFERIVDTYGAQSWQSPRHDAHESCAALEAAADEGCVVCRGLWRSLTTAEKAHARKVPSEGAFSFLAMGMRSFSHGTRYYLSAMTRHDDGDVYEDCYFDIDRLHDVIGYYPADPAGTLTESDAALEQATRWLNECCNNHAECKDQNPTRWHPTRLLDVGLEMTGHVRLSLSGRRTSTDDYVTLSHCWGTTPRLMLTKRTEQELLHGIETSKLPLTFQHAITVTRRLSKRFLWIDSLCIFQDEDDRADWVRETRSMDRVYAEACMNIAATWGTDDDAGLFVERDPLLELAPATFPWTPPGIDCDTEPWVVKDRAFLEQELMDAPLHKRAWVLQERILAKRVLHFCSGQLFWECKHGTSCERFPQGLPPYFDAQDLHFKKFAQISRRPDGDGSTRDPVFSVEHYVMWRKVVKAYSSSLLTYPDDKVVALSGVARLMQRIFLHQYVAGMWRPDLESQLLWQVAETHQVDGSPPTRDFAYRAPTWSWLSVDGVIECPYGGHAFQNLITIVDVSLEYKDLAICGGALTLEGRLRAVQLLHRPPRSRRSDSCPKLESNEVDFDRVETQLVAVHGHSCQRHKDAPRFDISYDSQQPALGEINRKGELYMTLMGSEFEQFARDTDTAKDSSEPDQDLGMFRYRFLLLRCVDAVRGVFHRLGCARHMVFQGFEKWDLEENLATFGFATSQAGMAAVTPCVAYDAASDLHTFIVE